MSELCEQLREALQEAGLGQAETARRLGISAKHINQILNGGTQPSLALAERIALLCGCELGVVPTGHKRTPNRQFLAQAQLNTELAELRVDNRDLKARVKTTERALKRIRAALEGTR